MAKVNRLDLNKLFLRLGLAGVMVFAPLALGTARLWSITIVELVVLALIFLWFWRMNNKTGWRFKPTALDLPIWAFVALASISCIFSIYLYDSLFEMKRLMAMVCIFYLAVNHFSGRTVGRMMTLIVIMAAAMSLFGLAQYFLNMPHPWWAHENFISSTYVNHNHFAGYLEMAIPLALGPFFFVKSPLRKIGFGCAAIVMMAAFIFAQSRGAWASIAIAVTMTTFYLSKKKIIKKSIFVLVALSLLLAFVIIYSGEDDIARRAGTMAEASGDHSFLTRIKIWQGTIEMIRHNPVIGTGIGTLAQGYPRHRYPSVDKKVVHAHNDYLHMTAEMGLLALPLMLWMIFIVLKKGFSLATQPVYAGITTGLLSIFLHSLIDFNLHIPANMMLVTLFSAFIMMAPKER